MTTYPIAIELTAWVELGLNQYEITIEKVSRVTVKRTDDVLRTRELTQPEIDSLLVYQGGQQKVRSILEDPEKKNFFD